MKLIVFGATGRTGTHLVHQALEQGRVTAVARDPSRISLEHEALTTVKADVTSVEALRPLLYGQDAVLSALGARRNREAGIVAQASRAVVSAMKESGTRRILVVSAAPVGPSPKGEKFAIRFLLTPSGPSRLRPPSTPTWQKWRKNSRPQGWIGRWCVRRGCWTGPAPAPIGARWDRTCPTALRSPALILPAPCWTC